MWYTGCMDSRTLPEYMEPAEDQRIPTSLPLAAPPPAPRRPTLAEVKARQREERLEASAAIQQMWTLMSERHAQERQECRR